MKTVIAFLNSAIDLGPVNTGTAASVQADEAREALYKIEHCELAMAALRTVLDHPNNAEAKTHAEKVLASIAWRPKPKAAPQAPAPAGETAVPSPSSKAVAPVGAAEDCADLV